MSSPFVAEIRIWACNFAPTGWAFCDGQLLPISQNTALFSLLGTTYGGDGKSTFGLPDMQGNAPMFWGQSTTGTIYDIGEESGSSTVTLLQSEMPFHTHTLQAINSDVGNLNGPTPDRGLARSGAAQAYQPGTANITQLHPIALSVTGSGFPHNNMQPYLVLNFCIALQGVFPPRG